MLIERIKIMSKTLNAWIKFIENNNLRVNGVMINHRQETIASAFWEPYDETSIHRIYSITKTINAICIGILVDQKKLSLDETLDGIFKNRAQNLTKDARILKASVRDLLQMMSPHSQTTYKHDLNSSWFDSFFTIEADKEPGTRFNYDTSASYVLGVIVEEKSGMKYEDFIHEMLFDHLALQDEVHLLNSEEGYVQTGSGISMSLRDMMKLEKVFYNKLISDDFMAQMRTPIEFISESDMPSNLHTGYGFQVWLFQDKLLMWGMANQLLYLDLENEITIGIFANFLHQKDQEKIFCDEIHRTLLALDLTKQAPLRLSHPKLELIDYKMSGNWYADGIEVNLTPESLNLKTQKRSYQFLLNQKSTLSHSPHQMETEGGWLSETHFKLNAWLIHKEMGLFTLDLRKQASDWILESRLYQEFGFNDLNIQKTKLEKESN